MHIAAAPISMNDCGMAKAAEILGDKWRLLLLREAFYGVRRFDDLKEDIGIPGATLSDRLKSMVDDGLLEGHPYRQGNARPRTEYMLTEAGRDTATILLAMMYWADNHLAGKKTPLDMVSASSGEVLRIAFVNQDDNVVAPENILPRISRAKSS